MFDGHMLGYAGGIMMWLLWMLLIGVIVWAVYALAGGSKREDKSALDTLRDRYARGEIDQQEFEHMRKVLRSR